ASQGERWLPAISSANGSSRATAPSSCSAAEMPDSFRPGTTSSSNLWGGMQGRRRRISSLMTVVASPSAPGQKELELHRQLPPPGDRPGRVAQPGGPVAQPVVVQQLGEAL